MNPLTFQMQISNSLETQIKHYTEELNKLLNIANGKEIKIGVSGNLTQLVAELNKGMLSITNAQKESVEAGKKAEAQSKAQAEAIKAAAEAQARLNQLTKAHDEAMSKLSNLRSTLLDTSKEGLFVSEFMEIPKKIGKSLEAAAEKGKEYLKSIGKGWMPYTSSGERGIKGAFYDLEKDKKAIEAVRSMFKWDSFERYRGKSIDDVKDYIETLKTLRQRLTNQGDYGMPEWKGYNLEINALESLIKLFQKCKEEQDKFLESNKGSKYIDALPRTENAEYKYITESYKKEKELREQIAKAERDEKEAQSALDSEKAKQALLSRQVAKAKEKETQALEENTAAKEKNAQTKPDTLAAEAYRKQAEEVKRISDAYDLASKKYSEAARRKESFDKAQWSSINGSFYNKSEAEAWLVKRMMSQVKPDSTGHYSLNEAATRKLVEDFQKRYDLTNRQNAESIIRGMLNSSRGGYIKEGSFLTQFGQYFADVKPSDSIKTYARDKKAAIEEEKKAGEELDAVERNLRNSKAKLKQMSDENAEAAKKQAEANERLAAAQKKVQSSQPKQMEFDFTKQTTKLTEFAENVDRCIGRIKTSIESLTSNMGKGIDNTAFVQSLTAFTQAMQPFADLVEKLSASSGKYQDVMQKLAASSKDLLESVKQVKNVESSVNSKTTGDAQKDAAEGMRQYINNVNKLEHALMRLDNAIAQAESDKARIAKNGGETDKIQSYIDNLNRLRDAILKVLQNPDILGQKGTMFRGTSEELDGLIEKFKTAAAASKGTKEDIANILGLAREIGNKSPLGVNFIRGLGNNQNFTQYANKLEAAVPKLNVANEKMAESMARLDSVIGRSNGQGRVQELEQLKQKLQGFKDSLSGLSAIDAAAKLDNGFTKLIQDIQKATNAQENLLSSMSKLTFYQKSVDGMLGGKDFNDRFRNMTERYKTLTDEQGMHFIQNSGMLGDGGVFGSLEAFQKKVEEALKNPEILSQKGKVAELTMEFNKLSYAYHSCWSQAEKLASAQDRANKKSGGLTEDQIKLKEANDLYSAIVKKLTEYNNLISKAGKFNIDTTELEKAIAELEKFRAIAKTIADGKGVGANGETARQLRFSQGYVDASSKAEVSASTLRAEVSAARKAATATERLSAEQQRLADAFRSASREARGQSQVLSDLKSLSYQYFSVYGIQSFLSELTNVTGELELQKKSLEVILGSGTAATEMYMQLRDLSQQSPYTFEDLLKSHRQLAAFGIEAKNIYGTMKSLTDIGAGLDVDVSRLILAYGHTKSYGYLSGIQNRQFETAGIDLVGGLTDLYNKRADEDKRAGRPSDYMSRKDIFGLMRKREIPFKDVEEVIMDLDKPGGKFYNMQERQYNTIGGKLRNLKNNYRIMLSEIGGSGRGMLMGILNSLNELTGHWERYAKVIMSVAAAYGTLKAAQMIAGRSMLAQNAAIATTNRMLQQTQRGMNLLNSTINGRGLGYLKTVFQNPSESAKRWLGNAGNSLGITKSGVSSLQMAKNQLIQVNEIKNNKELTNIQKQRIALTGQLTAAQRKRLLVATGLNSADAAAIAKFGAVRRHLLSVRLGFIQAAAAARSFMVSLLPQLGFMAAISAITSFFTRASELSSRAKELGSGMKEDSATNVKTAKEIIDSYADRGWINTNSSTKFVNGDAVTSNSISLNRNALKGVDLASEIEELKKKLQVLSPFYDGDLFDMDKMRTQEEEFEQILKKIDSYRKMNEISETYSDALANADKRVSGGNWFTQRFGDTFTEDMQDYADKAQRFRDKFMSEASDKSSDAYISDRDLFGIDKALKGELSRIKGEEGLADTREALRVFYQRLASMSREELNRSRSKFGGKDYREILSTTWLKDNQGRNALSVFNNLTDKSATFRRSMESDWDQVKSDAAEWSKSVASIVKQNFGDDPDGAAGYMVQVIKRYLSFGGITNGDDTREMTKAIIQGLNKNGTNILGMGLGDIVGLSTVKDDFGKSLGNIVPNMSSDEVKKRFDAAKKLAMSEAKALGINLEALAKKQGYKTAEAWLWGLTSARVSKANNMTEWQKRALKMNLKVDPDMDVDYTEFIKKQRQAIKTAQDILNANKKKIKFVLGLDVTPDFNFKDSKSAQAFLDKLVKARDALIKNNNAFIRSHRDKQGYVHGADWTTVQNNRGNIESMNMWIETLKTITQGTKYLESEHQAIGDKGGGSRADTAKNKADEAKRKADAAAEKADRNDIKQFNDRINALGKARQMYEEWYNRYKDKDYAIAQVRERMESALNKGEYVKGSINADDFKKLDSLEALRDVLVKEQDIIGKWKPRTQNGKEQKNSMLANVESQINQLDTKEADKRLKEFADSIKRLTELVSNAYDTFKSVRDKTGDTDFALELSRFRYNVDSRAAGFDWTENVNNLFSIVSSKLSEIGAQLFSAEDMGELYNLTGDNLKSRASGMLQRNLSKKDGESDKEFEKRRDNMLNHVDAIVSIVEQFNSAMKNMVKAANETATELYTSSNTLKERRQKAQTQFELNEKNIDRQAFDENGNMYYVNGSKENRAMLHRKNSALYDPSNKNGIAWLQYDGEMQRMLNAPTTMQSSKVRQLAHAYISAFNEAFTKGFIDEAKRNTEVDKAQKAMRDSLKSTGNSLVGQMAFMGGMFFDPTKHTQDLQNMRNSATVQLSEQMALPQEEQDANLIAVLQRLVQALDNILSGVGGKSEVAAAARAQRNVNNWSKMNGDQQAKAGDKAKNEFSKNVNDPFGFWEKSSEAVQNAMSKFIGALSAGSQAVNLLSDTFDKLGLGDTGMGQALSDAGGVMSGMLSGASSLSALGPYGMAAGATLGLIGGIAQTHDKRLQRKIEKMQEDVSKIESYTQIISKAQERTLGYDYGDVIRSYQKMYNTGGTNVSGAALGAMKQYYAAAGGGDITGYQQQYNLLVQKRKDYSDMYNAENRKKKKSKSSLEEYKSKIAELDDQIKYFSEDIAKNLYSIDLKSWADQLSDALMTAFENGDDAAEAFKNSVTSILQSLTKQMISLGVMQPLFDKLRNRLFGYTDANGVVHKGSFDASHPDSNKEQWMSDISEALGKDGYIYNGMEASKVLFDQMEAIAEKSNNTLLNNGSSSTSSSIKGITEQAADILASYLNAIRADVSVIRQLQGGKATEYMDNMSLMAQSQVQYQSQIAANTLRNAEAAEKVVASNDEILYLFRAVTNDTKMVSTRVR